MTTLQAARTIGMLALLTWTHVDFAVAQPLGTYRWHLTPYCNVLTLSVTQVGGTYRLEGVDELCGGVSRAAVVGMAYPRPDGTIGFGMTVVLEPGATSLNINASISPLSLSGTWQDDAGNSGAMVFNPTIAQGNPRPQPDRSTSGFVVLNSDATIRALSANMAGVTIQKPPATVGIYCFRFPPGAGFQRGGAVGSISQAFTGNGVVGFITVTSTITSACNAVAPYDLTVQTYGVDGLLANRFFRLFVPR